MEIDCDVKELLVDVCTVLCMILFITSTLNHDFWTNKMDCVGKQQVIKLFKKKFYLSTSQS